MPLVMGIPATLGKITAALGKSTPVLSDSSFDNSALRQMDPLRSSAESRPKPSSNRASGPPPAPMRMWWGNP
jgi:hypothetical protein